MINSLKNKGTKIVKNGESKGGVEEISKNQDIRLQILFEIFVFLRHSNKTTTQ